ADLEEVGLHELRQRLRLVVDRGGDRLDPDGTALELLDDGLEEPPVESIETAGVDALHREGRVGRGPGDPAVALDPRVVADAREPVDLVDEQDVPGLEAREDAHEGVTPLEGRARRALDLTPHLVGEDQRQRRLSETGRPRQQHVIEALLALARGLDGDLEALDGVSLADVLVEAARAQRPLGRRFLGQRFAGEERVAHAGCAFELMLTRSPGGRGRSPRTGPPAWPGRAGAPAPPGSPAPPRPGEGRAGARPRPGRPN